MNIKTYYKSPRSTPESEKIQLSEILYLEGCENYTYFHLLNGKRLISPRTMLFHIENSVNDSFIRIHKSFCVNKVFIGTIDFKYKEYVQLTNGKQLAVARRRRKILKEINLN